MIGVIGVSVSKSRPGGFRALGNLPNVAVTRILLLGARTLVNLRASETRRRPPILTGCRPTLYNP
jgi:hypothetical protein